MKTPIIYEAWLVGYGDVERLLWEGDLFVAIDAAIPKNYEYGDSGVCAEQRDMQYGYARRDDAQKAFEAIREILAKGGLPYECGLNQLFLTDDELGYYDREVELAKTSGGGADETA